MTKFDDVRTGEGAEEGFWTKISNRAQKRPLIGRKPLSEKKSRFRCYLPNKQIAFIKKFSKEKGISESEFAEEVFSTYLGNERAFKEYQVIVARQNLAKAKFEFELYKSKMPIEVEQ